MNSIFFLVLRRMRAPLIVLISAYALAIIGMVLVPGTDPEGHPWRMDFLHAFYFISYTASTIGFGEIPYPFSPAQRLWATVSIYLTVIAWVYAIGNILALLQDRAFREAFTRLRFAHTVRRLREPFYLICGYGDTGCALTQALVERALRVVVLDIDATRIDALHLENYPVYVPALCADASLPERLIDAGLKHPCCVGVVALTNVDAVNLAVAMTGMLLNPDGKVICRGESHEVEANMRSFGTHAVVDPYDTFAAHLALALHFPYLHQLTDRLAGIAGQHRSPLGPPRGPWVLCGFDRFGKEVYKRLQYEGIRATVVAPDPDAVQCEGNCVVGLGAEAVTLRAAHIDRAMGIVAGTDDDISNLSILVTARELNPGLFTVVRQNRRAHQVIFDAVQADIVMQKGQIVAERIRVMLTMPLLMEFLRVIRREREPWAKALLERIAAVVGDQALRVWEVTVDEDQAHAVDRALAEGRAMLLDHLLRDMSERERMLACLPLMVLCGEERRVLPGADLPLQHGDSLLFCGTPAAASHMQWTLQNPVVLTYVVTGDTHPQGLLWRWWLHGTRRPA